MNGESNGKISLGRVILWALMAVTQAACFLLWFMLANIQGKIEAFESNKLAVAVTVARLTDEQTRTAKDIGELKGGLQGVEKALQALTLALERQQLRRGQ